VAFHPTLILEGFETIRVSEPIHGVYILYDGKTDKNDRYRVVSRRNARKLARALSFFKPVKLPVNPLSYSSAFSRIYGILLHEKRRGVERVYIDVTDMPPLMAAAAGVVAMMFEGAEVYSVMPDIRGDFIPDPRTPEFDDWVEKKDNARAQFIVKTALPNRRLHVVGEDEDRVKILKMLYSMGGSARSIKELITSCGESPEKPEVKAVFSRWLKELEEEGLVEKAQEGRERRVSLTPFGKTLVAAIIRGEQVTRAGEPPHVRVARHL